MEPRLRLMNKGNINKHISWQNWPWQWLQLKVFPIDQLSSPTGGLHFSQGKGAFQSKALQRCSLYSKYQWLVYTETEQRSLSTHEGNTAHGTDYYGKKPGHVSKEAWVVSNDVYINVSYAGILLVEWPNLIFQRNGKTSQQCTVKGRFFRHMTNAQELTTRKQRFWFQQVDQGCQNIWKTANNEKYQSQISRS